jgi:triacylglycerol lipase
VVAAIGVGCGTASAEPAGEVSSVAKSSSPDSDPSKSSNGTPARPHHRKKKTTPSPSDEAGAGSAGASKDEAASDPASVERRSDRTVESHSRRGTSSVSDEPRRLPATKGADRSTSPEQASADTETATNKPMHAAESVATDTSAIAGQDSSKDALSVTPKTVSAMALVDIAQREQNANPIVTAAEALAGLDAVPPAVYTGHPSVIQQVVVLALRIVNAALSPVGGILGLTGLKVPIFADGAPPFFVTAGLNVKREEIAGMPVYILTPPTPTGATVVALHGGAYVAEASIFHWETYADLARRTGATVIVPDYPLIGEPGGTADVVVPQTAELISTVIATRGADNTYVLGDSAGGGLALAAVQLLVASGAATPRRMVLLAPWLDATVSDPASAAIVDPLLNVPTLVRDGELWAGQLGPSHPWASPINGSLDGLPPITVYSGSLDLLSPQALRFRERAIAGGADIRFELRNGLMHDYPIFFFLPDALAERASIYRALLGDDSAAKDPLRAS